MAIYNLSSLLHRSLVFSQPLPDGTTFSTTIICEIPVCIPPIQRDYAEGRADVMIERKRQNLINDMLDVVYNKRPGLSFDFIYGYLTNNGKKCTLNDAMNISNNVVFEPLDGQQRLTTLFLLYWLFGRNDDIKKSQSLGVAPSQPSHSLLVYKTRSTSEEFCNWLVGQDSISIINGWVTKRQNVEKQNSEHRKKWNLEKDDNQEIDPIANRLRYPLKPVPTLLDYLRSLDDFKWNWHDDPNVLSMITVLEHTYILIIEKGWLYSNAINNNANLDKITFHLLDDLDCDGDALFEKMNARGKALTPFDILKSSLEEEMERQNLPTTRQQLVTDWRDAIDGSWIDYCWDNSSIGPDPDLDTIRGVEQKLERLLVRMIAKSFFNKEIVGSQPEPNAKDYRTIFENSITDDINHVFDLYADYIRHERSITPSSISPLDFNCIYYDIDNLLYQDKGNKWHDASQMLPPFHKDNTTTLLDDFMSDVVKHVTRVRVYAMTSYLNVINADAINKDKTGIEKANFIDWMRFICNLYNADNMNSRLNDFKDVKKAISAIDDWIQEFKSRGGHATKQAVLKLITNYIVSNHNGQESARIEEEVQKAELRISGSNGISASDWELSLLTAENNYYLWGQIGAPLSWVKDSSGLFDKTRFDNYIDRLNKIFQNTSWIDNTTTDILLTQAILCKKDYRFNMSSSDDLGSLGRFNYDRDYSWKRYLRDKDSTTGYHGVLIKNLIDEWMLPANYYKDFDAFLRDYIDKEKVNINKSDWRYFIVNIKDPQTLLDIFARIGTTTRYIYIENSGHAFFFKSKTMKTANRYELLTTYLAYEKRLYQNGVSLSKLSHTAESDGAYVELKNSVGDSYRLSLDSGNLYILEQTDSSGNKTQKSGLDVSSVESELISHSIIHHL